MKCQKCGKEYPHRKGRFCGACLPPLTDLEAAIQHLKECKTLYDMLCDGLLDGDTPITIEDRDQAAGAVMGAERMVIDAALKKGAKLR